MNSFVFYLKDPEYLWGLVLVPLLLIFFRGSLYRTKKKLARFGEKDLIKRITPENSTNKQILKFSFLILAYIFLILHLSNTVISYRKEIQNPADIFFLVDVSNSMLAEDILPSRLAYTQSLIKNNLKIWSDCRIGIIPFAGQSYIAVPLTRNFREFSKILTSLSPGSIPVQGTLISSALQLAIESFSLHTDRTKIIILLTDGENHESAAMKLALTLNSKTIHLLVVGVGSTGGAKIPLNITSQPPTYLKDKIGNTVITKLNPKILEDLALSGEGKFIPALTDKSDISSTLQKYQNGFRKAYLDQVQNIDFPLFLFLALSILLIEFLVFERKNKFSNMFQPRPIFLFWLILSFIFMGNSVVKAQSFIVNRGISYYHQGNWEKAEKTFKNGLDSIQSSRNSFIRYNLGCVYLQEKKWIEARGEFNRVGGDPKNRSSLRGSAYYNLGNLAFSLGHYEESIQDYIKTLGLNPSDKDALFNLALARWKLKQKIEPPPPPLPQESPENTKKIPDPKPAPKKKSPLKSHLDKNGNGKKDNQSLEQNW
jgi:tetratricopeptide (TPR) repeat protein